MQTLLIIINVLDDVKLASMASEAVISNEPTSVQIKGMFGSQRALTKATYLPYYEGNKCLVSLCLLE